MGLFSLNGGESYAAPALFRIVVVAAMVTLKSVNLRKGSLREHDKCLRASVFFEFEHYSGK